MQKSKNHPILQKNHITFAWLNFMIVDNSNDKESLFLNQDTFDTIFIFDTE